MNKTFLKLLSITAVAVFLSLTALELTADARAGGSRSSGSRGSRSYSSPSSSYSQPSPTRQQVAPATAQPAPFQQAAGGGFLRSMAGGIAGGLLGGLLFSSLGHAGMGGGLGGSGIGLFEIILVAGIGYLIFRMMKSKKEGQRLAYQEASQQGGFQRTYEEPAQTATPTYAAPVSDRETGFSHIQRMDASFDEARFKDTAMDVFFKVQGGWMNRDLAPVKGLLTDEMARIFQEDIDRMLRGNTVNRLENIAVRTVELTEAWQESGQDFLTARIYANLLDYTTSESTGDVVAGSKSEPVKFEEYWTFTRPIGNNPWRLSAINQA